MGGLRGLVRDQDSRGFRRAGTMRARYADSGTVDALVRGELAGVDSGHYHQSLTSLHLLVKLSVVIMLVPGFALTGFWRLASDQPPRGDCR